MESSSDYQYKYTLRYDSYDKKANPLYKSFYMDTEGAGSFSKNNPTEVSISSFEKDSYGTYTYNSKLQYSYVYEKNVPTEIESKEISEGDVYIFRTYYEYE